MRQAIRIEGAPSKTMRKVQESLLEPSTQVSMTRPPVDLELIQRQLAAIVAYLKERVWGK